MGLYDDHMLISTESDIVATHLDEIDTVAFSTVGQITNQQEVISWLEATYHWEPSKSQLRFFSVTHQTSLNFENHYGTPETLGLDRIALVAGGIGYMTAQHRHGSVLIIDAGTCITFDYARFDGSKYIYEGGAISPGWQMRLNAMHHFTAKLPQLSNEIFFNGPYPSRIGQTTATCMHSGAFWGVIGELNYMINSYFKQDQALTIVFSGGDAPNFASLLDVDVVLMPHLVLDGINQLYLSSSHA